MIPIMESEYDEPQGLTEFEHWAGATLLMLGAQLLQIQVLVGAKNDPELWAQFMEASALTKASFDRLSGELPERLDLTEKVKES